MKEDILFFEADHVYLKLYIEGKTQAMLIRQTLKELGESLPNPKFLRIDRSFLVNLEKVERWNKSNLYIGDHEIPISCSKKEQLFEFLRDA